MMDANGRFSLQGKVALVTGASRGLGRGMAIGLAEAGADVVVHASVPPAGTAREIEQLGRRAVAFGADLADRPSVDRLAQEAVAAFGRIDILVNNAGISGPNLPTWDYPAPDWARVIAVNLTGTFNCCKAVAPMMIAQNYGRVVNIASIAGKEGNPNACAYSASKAGVIALTKSLGKELAGYDIAVNCVTPAVAKTAIFDQMTKEHIAYMLSKIPRGRFVKVEEIADLVAFCASQECTFTTGAVFDISGGRATY